MKENIKRFDKNQEYSKELEKLQEIFKNIEVNKKNLVSSLIEQCAFMSATLKELTNIINKEGAIIRSKSGNGFDIITESPAQKSYSTLINRYSNCIKQLILLLPDETTTDEADELTDFLEGSRDV